MRAHLESDGGASRQVTKSNEAVAKGKASAAATENVTFRIACFLCQIGGFPYHLRGEVCGDDMCHLGGKREGGKACAGGYIQRLFCTLRVRKIEG